MYFQKVPIGSTLPELMAAYFLFTFISLIYFFFLTFFFCSFFFQFYLISFSLFSSSSLLFLFCIYFVLNFCKFIAFLFSFSFFFFFVLFYFIVFMGAGGSLTFTLPRFRLVSINFYFDLNEPKKKQRERQTDRQVLGLKFANFCWECETSFPTRLRLKGEQRRKHLNFADSELRNWGALNTFHFSVLLFSSQP